MKKIIVTLAAGLTVCAVQADVVLSNYGSAVGQGRVLTFAETATDVIAVSESFGNPTSNPIATGSYSVGGLAGSFTATFRAYSDWSDTAGTTNMSKYLANELTDQDVSFNNAFMGATGGGNNFWLNSNADPLTNQAVVISYDTSGLGANELRIKGLNFGAFGNNDRVDFIVYSTVDDAVTYSSLAYNANNTTDAWVGDVALKTGDLLILKQGTVTDGAFGMKEMTYDVIPEPATLGLVAAFGGGILFIRRRFMM